MINWTPHMHDVNIRTESPRNVTLAWMHINAVGKWKLTVLNTALFATMIATTEMILNNPYGRRWQASRRFCHRCVQQKQHKFQNTCKTEISIYIYITEKEITCRFVYTKISTCRMPTKSGRTRVKQASGEGNQHRQSTWTSTDPHIFSPRGEKFSWRRGKYLNTMSVVC